jgi:hypothetical protein
MTPLAVLHLLTQARSFTVRRKKRSEKAGMGR